MATKNQHYVPRVYTKAWETQVSSLREPRRFFTGVYYYEKPNLVTGDGRNKGSILTTDHTYTIDYNYTFILPQCPEIRKEFADNIITVTTKAGNYFYILIDRANEDKETAVHFLNQVDEADLLALMEDGEVQETPAVCTCTEKCQAGAVNTACPVCAVNMSECAGKSPEVEPEPEPESEKESGSSGALVLILLLAALGGGGAFAYIKFIKPKQGAKVSADPDDYEFEDEEYENEDVPEQEEQEDQN